MQRGNHLTFLLQYGKIKGKRIPPWKAGRESSPCAVLCRKEHNPLKITLNPDQEIVKTVKEGLKARGGYCPCRREMTPETKCMCKEFRDQIADPNFEGFCHCMLYYKSNSEEKG
ncbi:MAG: hypothetical protein J5938_01625 [Clostridia bacterium]|nr:hypothetical protein [Clostridia bacterium]